MQLLKFIYFRILLVYGGGVLSQQIGMVAYGIASATETAFYSYMYAKVTKDEYQRYVLCLFVCLFFKISQNIFKMKKKRKNLKIIFVKKKK